MKRIHLLIAPLILIASCTVKQEEKPLEIKISSARAKTLASQIEAATPIQLAPGLKISLWASDSLAPDPIAMSVDEAGNVYLTSTERQKNSEFDIRGFQHWMIPSIALTSVEDRRAFLRKTFATEKSEANQWLKDMNGDSLHDWRDLAVEKDEVWKIQDQDGDGLAERATRIVQDFNEEITDVAEGLLVREKDMFIGIGPDLWRLIDKNGDGVPETKESISHGYAVHIGFSGHGMSGVVEGPDGKIYWGIGDIGANIVDKQGNRHYYPNEGIIVRANPDGSDFEVFASGLRNTHEFVFDAYGNLITSDNDGDHPGESERLMHVVEGADIGWRANWQYGKYTDPKNNGYNVWMEEQFYIPKWEGQAAHILPPIRNYHNGPTGMVFNPGNALGKSWRDRFFLVEFTGTPSRAHIWSFTLKPKGASFDFNEEIDMVGGLLPTGIRFGPDGALYAADWVTGWGTKDYGRVWKIDVNEANNDLSEERKSTRELLSKKFKDLKTDEVKALLAHGDMRVRQKAQFELVDRGSEGRKALESVATSSTSQLARIHSIWGLGQQKEGGQKLLTALLADQDPEIIAQSAKVLGDTKYAPAGQALIDLLKREEPRVKFFAAQGLGRLGEKNAINPLIEMIRENNGSDLYLRLAGVVALARIGAEKEMAALSTSDQKELRIAAVLVLRRLKSVELRRFLDDADEYLVTEAVRAIHDDLSVPSLLPDVAQLLQKEQLKGEPLLRRAISAAQRAGGKSEMTLLAQFAERKNVPVKLRAEAFSALGTWSEPSLVDRVDGYYRGPVKRDAAPIKNLIGERGAGWLTSTDEEILLSVIKAIERTSVRNFDETLANLSGKHTSGKIRAACLITLDSLGFDGIENLLAASLKDKSEEVRSVAISLLPGHSLSNEKLLAISRPLLEKGSVREQQQLLKVLSGLPANQSESLLNAFALRLGEGKSDKGILLELASATKPDHSEALRKKVEALKGNNNELLFGGIAERGEGYFFWNQTGQCIRCHAMGNEGGKVGPPLEHIGDVLNREQILEAMINPTARLAPGYGSVTVTLTDGSTHNGILMSEDASSIAIKTQDAEPLKIALSRIKERKNSPSGMPAMGSVMSPDDIRNMVEYLSTRKKK